VDEPHKKALGPADAYWISSGDYPRNRFPSGNVN